ncbi:MAG TPA: chromosomal replication initiator DnaA [Pararhodobacter sp.]|uniref:chromosomal replication initiator DnaA n=1 Tax=Pararhodobacter sp. TaxID=2127056 RepID=UPI002B524494|nr:chromosomal replication initiator DnaA [Pararhodobacter sp.]HPD93477.1 chromosomal replication initiator DnaA [Pararhodobacter sp.]
MTTPPRAEQLPLDLPADPAMGRADFLQAPSNALALATIEAPGGLPRGIAVLSGPGGSGKTHLARIWASREGARWQPADRLARDLPGLLATDGPLALALDDADRLAGDRAGEEALFHLLNHLRGRGQILLTATHPVRDWGLALPDLVSRLTAATHLTLAEPDEALLGAVLVKLFADRQLRVDPALIAYLLGRMERSLGAARRLVADLDARSMARKRPVTRDLARDLLAQPLDSDGPDTAS